MKNTNNTNKNMVITGAMVTKAVTWIGIAASTLLIGSGVILSNIRFVGIGSLFVCFLAGFLADKKLKNDSDAKLSA